MTVDVCTHIWDSPDQLGPAAAARYRALHPAPWDRLEPSPAEYAEALAPARYALVHGLISATSGANVRLEQVARFVARQPHCCLGFAGIDPLHDDLSARLTAAADRGLVGVTISPAEQGFHPAHTHAMALYEQCAHRGWPVFVHPGFVPTSAARLDLAQPFLFDEVARAFPHLRLVIGGVGHPFVEQTLALLAKHCSVYAEVSGVADRPWQLYQTLVAAHEQGVIDRLLLGSGFPRSTPARVIHALGHVNHLVHGTMLPTLPADALRGIIERDTLACLGLQPPAASAAPEDPAGSPDLAHLPVPPGGGASKGKP